MTGWIYATNLRDSPLGANNKYHYTETVLKETQIYGEVIPSDVFPYTAIQKDGRQVSA
jgi:hypothetical protein